MNKIEQGIREGGDYSVGLNDVAVIDNTFWFDFSVADAYRLADIEDTYNRSFKAFKNDIAYITALSLVLNHKGWQHYREGDEEKAKLYFKLYEKLDAYVLDGKEKGGDYEYKNYNKEEVNYYVRALD